MNNLPVLGCALNLSEGRRTDVVTLAAKAASTSAALLDITSDPDHNRSVLTFAGHPEDVVNAALKVAAAVLPLVDLNRHRGVHPRTGVVDVVPFYPVQDSSLGITIDAAVRCAGRLWSELALPSFLYEAAARSPEAQALPWIRKHAFNGLAPDFGGPLPHPTAGATVVGARGLLVAYNVDIRAEDAGVARAIAANIRRRYPGQVRALGLYLKDRGVGQVSMNILTPRRLTLNEVFAAVSREAAGAGAAVVGSEIIGLVPRACIDVANADLLNLREKPLLLEDAVEKLFAD